MLARSSDLPELQAASGVFATATLVAAIAGAAWRERAAPLLHAAGLATLSIASWPILGGSLDVDFVGLGAYTSVISNAGSDVVNERFHTTTGNSLTAMVGVDALVSTILEEDDAHVASG